MKNLNFCVLPFFSFENAKVGSADHNVYCCRLPVGTDIQHLRYEIKQGARSASCSTCWKLEDQGLQSERNLHNSSLDYYWDRDLDQIESDAYAGNFSTRMIKLATSNICNGTCVTCGPNLSSAWAKLRQQPIQYESLVMDNLQQIQWADVKSLGFVGGEPLLEKTNFDILEHLLRLGNDSCFIHIVTNGSITLTPRQIELLSGFRNLNLCVSIDGVFARFEYLRFPLKWSTLNNNLDVFSTVTDNISVSCMVSNLSVIYLDETLNWFKSQSLRYLAKQIDHPSCFSPGNLPHVIKQQLLDHTQYPTEMQTFLNCGSHSTELWSMLWQQIAVQDNLKKISMDSYMPLVWATKTA